MSCTTGDRSCDTPRRRGALAILGIMAAIFVVLSVFSFVGSRKQATPDEFTYRGYTADQGKRVFQAYNCMGCHTIVGNGAYFGPDLTKEYKDVGPAWLEAFLPSAGSWPTAAAVRLHLAAPEQQAAADAGSLDDYLARYPGAAGRIERRGGKASHMPNLPFREGEVGKLIAFLKYTSAMNTEGWPPRIESGDLAQRLHFAYGVVPAAVAATAPADASAAGPAGANAADNKAAPAADAAQLGERLANQYGCTACHATDTTRKVGPGWGGLYGKQVTLADGSQVKADKSYLVESIRDPNAKVVQGYPASVMPAYAGQLTDDEVDAIVAYLISLGSAEKQ